MFYQGSKQPALITYTHRKPWNMKWKWHDIKLRTENEVLIGQTFLQYINCLYYTAVRSPGCKSMRFTTTSSYTQEYYILFCDPRAGPEGKIKISLRPTLWRKRKKNEELNKRLLFTCFSNHENTNLELLTWNPTKAICNISFRSKQMPFLMYP